MQSEALRSPVGEEFRQIAEAMPQLIWTAKPDGTIDYLNRRWIEYTGVDIEELHRRAGNVGVIHPDDLDETWRLWRAALRTGEPYEQEYRIRRESDGSYHWFLGRAVPVRGAGATVLRWIGTATDIDDRHRAAKNLQFTLEVSNALATSLEVDAVCQKVADAAIGYIADWCFVTLKREDTFQTCAIAHKNEALRKYLEQFAQRYSPRPEDTVVRVIERNEPVLFAQVTQEQLESAARDAEHLRLLELLRMQSVMVVPLTSPEGDAIGAISMVSSEPGRLFNETDVNVAKAVAERTAVAIANARIFELQRYAAEALSLTGRINQLLFESSDPWEAMERVARVVAEEIADTCAIVRLEDDTIRTEIVVHRDPSVDAAIGGLRRRRTLRLQPERELARRLREHETIVLEEAAANSLRMQAWPYLAAEIDALHARSSIIVPWYAGSATYGALAAYYSERPFDRRDVALLEEIARRASVAVERAESLARERRIATTLQQASLPSLIPQPDDLRFDAVYAPAGEEAEVGGDWYDAIELDDGSVVVSVGDVTGRGIQAAAIMSKVRHAMGMAPLHESDPSKILDSAGWFLGKRYPDAIVTAFVGIISPDRLTFRFATAGHPLPLLRRGNEVIELEAGGLPLGLRQSYPATDETATIDLREGDILLLYTDGLTEAQRDVIAGEAKLREVVKSDLFAASANPAKLVARACMPPVAHDDVAILAVSVSSAPPWTLYVDDARAAVDARSLFREFLNRSDGDPHFVEVAELVFGELLGNVVRHAPGPVELAAELHPDSLVLHVIDSGPPLSAKNHHLPEDILSERGRGLFIVTALTDDLRIDHVENCGNHIAATIARTPRQHSQILRLS